MLSPRARHNTRIAAPVPAAVATLLANLLATTALSTPALAQIQNITKLTPVADTFVCGNPTRANQNFGAAGALSVAPSGSTTGEFRSLLRFDLASSVAAWNVQFGPGAWTLVAADVNVVALSPLNPIFNSNVAGDIRVEWQQNDAWVEGTGRPNAPTTDGVTFNTLTSFISGADRPLATAPYNGLLGSGTVPLTLDAAFVADLTAGGLLSLRMSATTGRMVYGARENSPAAERTTITLTVEGPCRADLTTGAIPGQPGYLTPNGTLNNDDFFAYLIEFSSGNLAVADLTTTAVAGQPGYGIPNGVLNNDDFFFYLIIFSAGC